MVGSCVGPRVGHCAHCDYLCNPCVPHPEADKPVTHSETYEYTTIRRPYWRIHLVKNFSQFAQGLDPSTSLRRLIRHTYSTQFLRSLPAILMAAFSACIVWLSEPDHLDRVDTLLRASAMHLLRLHTCATWKCVRCTSRNSGACIGPRTDSFWTPAIASALALQIEKCISL